MSVQLVRGNALALPLADNTVDLVVTSPPYFSLRSYTDDGEHYAGQIGSEPSSGEFIEALLDATAEMVRVLKPSGSIWVNLGDKAASSGGHTDHGQNTQRAGRKGLDQQRRPDRRPNGHRLKSLMGLPWRYAIACMDELGLILRAEVIWSKPNGLPESVTDRVRRSHETWFHFTVQKRYYSALDAIREPYDTADRPGSRSSYMPGQTSGNTLEGHSTKSDAGLPLNPLGKVPGSVWSIATQPLTVPAELGIDHFAAFPMEWPRRLIRGWSPAGICTSCGQGRRLVSVNDPVGGWVRGTPDTRSKGTPTPRPSAREQIGGQVTTHARITIVGEECGCETPSAPTRPAVILDPFGGTGTTALVAHALGRHGISVDMSGDYCRLARWRTSDPGQFAAALEVEKPAPVADGQLDLLELL